MNDINPRAVLKPDGQAIDFIGSLIQASTTNLELKKAVEASGLNVENVKKLYVQAGMEVVKNSDDPVVAFSMLVCMKDLCQHDNAMIDLFSYWGTETLYSIAKYSDPSGNRKCWGIAGQLLRDIAELEKMPVTHFNKAVGYVKNVHQEGGAAAIFMPEDAKWIGFAYKHSDGEPTGNSRVNIGLSGYSIRDMLSLADARCKPWTLFDEGEKGAIYHKTLQTAFLQVAGELEKPAFHHNEYVEVLRGVIKAHSGRQAARLEK